MRGPRQPWVFIQTAVPFVILFVNDCVHTCILRLGFGNLSSPEHGTANTAMEAGRKGGGNRQLSLLLSVTFSPSLPAHLCLSLSLKLSFCEGCVSSLCPHTTCDFQPCCLALRPSVCFGPVEERQARLIIACVYSSLSVVCLHADTPTQMISRRFLPREVFGLPVFPQVETICPQSFAQMPASFTLLATRIVFIFINNIMYLFTAGVKCSYWT